MNQVTEIWRRAETIAQITELVYFSIPEEFWDGPEHVLKNLENYTLLELQEILDWIQKASEDLNHIWNVKAKIRDEVHSLSQARLLIVAQIMMNRKLVEKIVQKSEQRRKN